jgi:Flp pilus assembly secretin CpaC
VRHTFATLGIIAVLGVPTGLLAQDPVPATKPEAAKPAAAPPRSVYTPLRLQVTISRYQGNKKISSLPYSLSLGIGGPRVQFRVGAQVPYATTSVTDGVKTPSYSYRDVGVGIDVSGQALIEAGLYKMDINVSDSSVSSSSQIQGAPAITGVPIFRNFNTGGTVMLRDGQTTQLTAAGDPITGETLRVDVTLTVVK